MLTEMTKLKCKKALGVWYYRKETPTAMNGLDAPIYSLYDDEWNFKMNFGSYGDMKYYVETGVIL